MSEDTARAGKTTINNLTLRHIALLALMSNDYVN